MLCGGMGAERAGCAWVVIGCAWLLKYYGFVPAPANLEIQTLALDQDPLSLLRQPQRSSPRATFPRTMEPNFTNRSATRGLDARW